MTDAPQPPDDVPLELEAVASLDALTWPLAFEVRCDRLREAYEAVPTGRDDDASVWLLRANRFGLRRSVGLKKQTQAQARGSTASQIVRWCEAQISLLAPCGLGSGQMLPLLIEEPLFAKLLCRRALQGDEATARFSFHIEAPELVGTGEAFHALTVKGPGLTISLPIRSVSALPALPSPSEASTITLAPIADALALARPIAYDEQDNEMAGIITISDRACLASRPEAARFVALEGLSDRAFQIRRRHAKGLIHALRHMRGHATAWQTPDLVGFRASFANDASNSAADDCLVMSGVATSYAPVSLKKVTGEPIVASFALSTQVLANGLRKLIAQWSAAGYVACELCPQSSSFTMTVPVDGGHARVVLPLVAGLSGGDESLCFRLTARFLSEVVPFDRADKTKVHVRDTTVEFEQAIEHHQASREAPSASPPDATVTQPARKSADIARTFIARMPDI